jgi:hypothetical protein
MDSNQCDQDKDNGSSWPDDPAVLARATGKALPERSPENPRQWQPSQRHNRGPPPNDDNDDLAGDLLVGAGAIEAYLKTRGVPNPDAYYLRRSGKFPIGKYGAHLIASKQRLNRHAEKITRGSTAA